MDERLLLRESVEPGIVSVVFNRPSKMNALSTPLMDALDETLDALATDPEVRAIIFSGAGERAFIAGADIAEYRGRRTQAFVTYQHNSRRIFDRLEALPKPTIAAVHGYALGGGFELALCCDVIVCAISARFGLPEGLLGLSPGGGGTQRLTRAVGKYVASDIMLGARRINGERAHELGLAAAVCPDEELMSVATERARAMLKVAPLSQAEMKQLIRLGPDSPLAVAESVEQEALFRLYETTDGQEGIDAFLDKRNPEFKGE